MDAKRIQLGALAVIVGETTALAQLVPQPWGALLAGVAATLAVAAGTITNRPRR